MCSYARSVRVRTVLCLYCVRTICMSCHDVISLIFLFIKKRCLPVSILLRDWMPVRLTYKPISHSSSRCYWSLVILVTLPSLHLPYVPSHHKSHSSSLFTFISPLLAQLLLLLSPLFTPLSPPPPLFTTLLSPLPPPHHPLLLPPLSFYAPTAVATPQAQSGIWRSRTRCGDVPHRRTVCAQWVRRTARHTHGTYALLRVVQFLFCVLIIDLILNINAHVRHYT